MRMTVVAAALAVCVLGFGAASQAQASIRRPTNIAAQKLGRALRKLAKEQKFQVLFRSDLVRDLNSAGAVGELTTDEALNQILSGTGLTYRYLNANTVTIVPAATSSDSIGDGAETGGNPTPTPDTRASSNSPRAGDSLRLAQATRGASSEPPPVTSASPTSAATLEEIIVTAQKREERLQDVPVPVTAISAAALVDRDQLRLQDFYSSVPGLTVAPGATSFQLLSIRGITTGFGTDPTVGVTIDDVPYGGSTNLGGGSVVPDIDPGDLARIEVLRGPQGTLYGASSMGGLVKFVTTDPSTEEVRGHLQVGGSGVRNGDGLGYNVRGSINVPVSDTAALLASGFTRQDPGYIDNPVLDINGLNRQRVSGGRLSGLWRPTQDFTLRLSALYQDYKGDGSSDVDVPNPLYPQTTGLGGLQQNYLRGTGGYDRKVQAYSATATANVSGIKLVSVTGYNVNESSNSFDDTYALGAFLTQPFFGVSGSPFFDSGKTEKFTEELRASGELTPKIDWLTGGFYTHESSHSVLTYVAEDPTTGRVAGVGLSTSVPTIYREYAGFADMTFHFTDRFDVQAGGRESEIRQTVSETNTGPYASAIFYPLSSPVIYPAVDSSASAFTYLVTPRFKLSSDLMLYARLASGYRSGGPNAAPGEPRQYSPDKTQTYEVGFKGSFLESALSVDASAYYIGWKDIQITLQAPNGGFTYNANGSRAKSEGVELSVEASPLVGMRIGIWGVWNEAVLTQPFPTASSAYGVAGDRLPYSSRWSGHLSLDEQFPLTSRVNANVGASLSYVGNRLGQFTSPPPAIPPRQHYPSYAETDIHAGLTMDSWTGNLFVNNLADKRGILRGGLGDFPPFAFTYIQPRTVGISIGRKF
jgi:iron complex outermembrane recepter protein